MREAAIIILAIYALANALIVWYFFVYKNSQADKEYTERLKRIYDRGSGYY